MRSLHVRARAVYRLAGFASLTLAAACTLQTSDEKVGDLSQAATCASGQTVKGVDVSIYQGTVNWPQVKAAGYDFAIARISDGSFLDTEFSNNWSGIKSAGMVRGAYQFFEPGQDPTTQANIVISAVGKLGAGDLPVTADMEVTGGQSAATVAANLQTWVNAVQAGTGKTPMIYTAPGWWDSNVGSTAFGADPLWVANWGVSCPSLPGGWSNWDFWQDSDMGSVSGISTTVDTDQFNGSLASLTMFAGGGGVVPDGGTSGYYGAQYVSQSWPLATMTMMMTTCQTVQANITLKNVGTKPWDSNTRLATTQPRDRTSVFADSTWVSTNRLAQVTGTVPPGGTFEFKFDFHAPPTAGTYDEFFGVVEDGVAWFSDPGQGGPADTDIEAKIQVTAGAMNCTTDPGVDSGVPEGGTKPPGDAGSGSSSGSGSGSGSSSGAGSSSSSGSGSGSGVESDSGSGSFANASPKQSSGCGCTLAGSEQKSDAGAWASAALAGLVLATRRRRSRPRRLSARSAPTCSPRRTSRA